MLIFTHHCGTIGSAVELLSGFGSSSTIEIRSNRPRRRFLDRSAKPLANPAVISRQIDAAEAVLVNLDTAASLALNATGYVIWQLVDEHALPCPRAGEGSMPDEARVPGRVN